MATTTTTIEDGTLWVDYEGVYIQSTDGRTYSLGDLVPDEATDPPGRMGARGRGRWVITAVYVPIITGDEADREARADALRLEITKASAAQREAAGRVEDLRAQLHDLERSEKIRASRTE